MNIWNYIIFLIGLQKHTAVVLAGGYLGQVIDGYRNRYLAERDAVLRHYVQLHPEDFPPRGTL